MQDKGGGFLKAINQFMVQAPSTARWTGKDRCLRDKQNTHHPSMKSLQIYTLT